jgi:hypothetical protein
LAKTQDKWVEHRLDVVQQRHALYSFVDAYPLELAVVEARKALSVEHWDWSVYSLMANTARLDQLRLLAPLSRSEPVG